MENLATDTEQLIKDTAKKVFFVEGRLHATTQDIADAAGINRASIHYYFRSRQLLFDRVFTEAITEMRTKLDAVFLEEKSLQRKIEKFIEIFTKKSLEHPYLEMFIITEFNTNPTVRMHNLQPHLAEEKLMELRGEIEAEVKSGRMRPMEPEHFVITMMSLCSFPILGKSILKDALGIDENNYQRLISERKKVIMQLIFPAG